MKRFAQLDVPADQPINNTYLEGDTVRVFGKVGRVVENKMAEIIVASDKHTYASGKVMPNPDGNFLYEFKITGPQPKPFTMKVKVSYDKRVLELPIKYLNDEPDPAKTRFDVINGFEVKTDKEIYNFGDTIIISGRVPEIVPGGHKVNINVFGSPLGMTGESATPNQDGTFSIEHKLTLPRYRETMYVEVYYYLQRTGTSSDKSFGKSIENGLRAINEILAHSESIPLKNRLKNEFKDDVKELDASIKKECKIIKYYSTKIKALASNKDWWKENKATLEKKTKNVLEKTKNLCPNEYKDALTNINNLFSK